MPLSMSSNSMTALMWLALAIFVAAGSQVPQPEPLQARLEGPHARGVSGAVAVRSAAAAVPWIVGSAFVIVLEPMVVPVAAMFAAYRFLS